MINFYIPDLTDERLFYAKSELENMGYSNVKKEENADFILASLGDEKYLSNPLTVKYFDDEKFLIDNAKITAEAAVGIAIVNSPLAIVGSNVLILGYGRIAKAVQKYLSSFDCNITVCARSVEARNEALSTGVNAVSFDDEYYKGDYDYIFNTVPFPVMSQRELLPLKKSCLLIELASLPGGIDKHYASLAGLNLITARRLPAKYAPVTAGKLVAEAVDRIVREGRA